MQTLKQYTKQRISVARADYGALDSEQKNDLTLNAREEYLSSLWKLADDAHHDGRAIFDNRFQSGLSRDFGAKYVSELKQRRPRAFA